MDTVCFDPNGVASDPCDKDFDVPGYGRAGAHYTGNSVDFTFQLNGARAGGATSADYYPEIEVNGSLVLGITPVINESPTYWLHKVLPNPWHATGDPFDTTWHPLQHGDVLHWHGEEIMQPLSQAVATWDLECTF
jgi:hypothetical protein